MAGTTLSHGALVPSQDISQIPDGELSIREQVRQYYGSILADSDDLKTNATCCATDAPPRYVLDVMPLIDDEIMSKFYGCGSPIPPALEGCTVLDLGCGVGRDVYVLSKLVGSAGRVIGVDMTPSQLAVAQAHEEDQARRFGFDENNVEFKCGYIEDLADLGIEDESIDLVVSNCVINLTPFKEQVFREIYRVLKPGGELYFSDVFCDRRMPEALRRDPVLLGECLGGAIYLEDFRRMMARIGWASFLYTAIDDIHVSDLALETKLGFTGFTSRTVRAIKACGLEDGEENWGQTARYLGTIPEMPRYFDLSEEIRLIKGRPVALSGNMAEMLAQSRYGAHFDISERGAHRGAFEFCRAQDAVEARRGKRAVDVTYLEEALGRIGQPSFEERVNAPAALCAPAGSETLQVNITYACNLACRHCYLECAPKSEAAMDRATMEACLKAFTAAGFTTFDITGGSPELHPDFPWFLREAARRAREAGGAVIVRTNLTLLEKLEYASLMDLFAEEGVTLVASLPYFDAEGTDAQRGNRVYERAVSAIRALNERGYGKGEGLVLDLAYNVAGPFLPPPQDMLEDLYRDELERREGVAFDHLYAFNNYPLGRFAHDLLDAGLFDEYLRLLAENFNALAVQRMMCRGQVNVDVDGRLYDCEVNHVLGLPIQLPAKDGAGKRDATVADLAAGALPERTVRTNPVCYSCAAGFGSSCGGSLVKERS
ncbi:arsenosugar biosynthesis radical SAM (seleno)protein ArsS [Adlercreutzia sp. R25]|uniref:arsenosugar biosynthesis radical SAM (seleno)protein ArsS n=1 Tax=Adlercreutzia shanghongiae TaxID=3111773 RepID=UPI002DB6F1D3|nr:arsenosugar biosynthesis radical SAM (seleno)protein ArsS [Adlercreutzia sp. R25]MEC4272637.1 arsenosugar biosynthesis radical SAM (seleno)protein ArsS [Adlercreutzia sp. R25]